MQKLIKARSNWSGFFMPWMWGRVLGNGFFGKKKGLSKTAESLVSFVAGSTRLELATSCVTGRRSNQTELRPRSTYLQLVGGTGLEPVTLGL